MKRKCCCKDLSYGFSSRSMENGEEDMKKKKKKPHETQQGVSKLYNKNILTFLGRLETAPRWEFAS